MNGGSIPRRYAKALLSLAVSQNRAEAIGAEVARVAKLLEHKELRDTLAVPTIPISKRKAILEQLVSRLAPSPVVRSFVLLLADRNRVGFLPDISREYAALADTHAGRIRAEVTSARPLDAASANELKATLERRTGKQVLLAQKTDPSLIAGLVTKVGSTVYDGSVRTRLDEMRTALLAGRQ
ncbi:MAG: ATP synthase F1 subunit delta [Deltaproteobacteria bacterium]|nr:ATP synthase F1 subunit delta [Deltaproteobacteria bacterium]